MKKVFYLFATFALVLMSVSCSNDDHDNPTIKSNIEERAAALGFDDVASYKTSVAEECANGNHENCDTFSNGTHEACAYKDHSGTNHDGTHHNGSDHGSHDANGHSHKDGNHH